MSDSGARVDGFQLLVGYTMFVLFEGAIVWNLYAEWLLDPGRAMNPSCEKHLQFAVHSMLAMFLTGGVLTYLFSDVDWQDTAYTRHYGYNDITVVLDYPPSIYVMPAYWFATGAGFLLYVLEDTRRLLRQSEAHPGMLVSFVVNGALSVSVVLFSLTLEIRAHQDMAAHVVPELFLVLVLPLPFIMHTFEAFWKRGEAQRLERTYGLLIIVVSWFTFVSMLKVCLGLFAAFVRPVGPSFAKPLDGLWLLLAFALPFLLHPAPGGAYQQVGADGGTSPRVGGTSSNRCLVAACAGLFALFVVGALYAALAKSPSFDVQKVAPTSNSAVGYETVRHSRHCAKRGEQCRCPGGFVLFGRGRERSYFEEGSSFARWDVYPERVQDSLTCNEAALGDPFIYSVSEECRCVESGLVCDQLSEQTAVGCGAGSTVALQGLNAGSEEMACCKRHDRCYGLCGRSKQQCDEEFDECLEQTCAGQTICLEQIQLMKQAVRTKVAEAAFSLAERSREHWVLSDPSAPIPTSSRHTPEDSGARASEASFDCLSGEKLWEVEWSDDKKAWCCQHEGRGCPVVGAPPASSSSASSSSSSSAFSSSPSSSSASRVTPLSSSGLMPATPSAAAIPSAGRVQRTTSPPPTTRAQRSSTTTLGPILVQTMPQTTAAAHLPERSRATTTELRRRDPKKPYNCLTTDTWPADKSRWCCTNLGLGCGDTRSVIRRLGHGTALRASRAAGSSRPSANDSREVEQPVAERGSAERRQACSGSAC